jgi:hypothetical protein
LHSRWQPGPRGTRGHSAHGRGRVPLPVLLLIRRVPTIHVPLILRVSRLSVTKQSDNVARFCWFLIRCRKTSRKCAPFARSLSLVGTPRRHSLPLSSSPGSFETIRFVFEGGGGVKEFERKRGGGGDDDVERPGWMDWDARRWTNAEVKNRSSVVGRRSSVVGRRASGVGSRSSGVGRRSPRSRCPPTRSLQVCTFTSPARLCVHPPRTSCPTHDAVRVVTLRADHGFASQIQTVLHLPSTSPSP